MALRAWRASISVLISALRESGAVQGYRMFRDKQDECIKVVLRP